MNVSNCASPTTSDLLHALRTEPKPAPAAPPVTTTSSAASGPTLTDSSLLNALA